MKVKMPNYIPPMILFIGYLIGIISLILDTQGLGFILVIIGCLILYRWDTENDTSNNTSEGERQ